MRTENSTSIISFTKNNLASTVLPGCNNIFALMIIFKKLFHYVSSLSSSHRSCLGRAGRTQLVVQGTTIASNGRQRTIQIDR